MSRIKVSAPFMPLFFLMFLQASMTAAPSLPAQTPANATGESNVFCLSDRNAPVIYFSEVFVGKGDPPSGRVRQVTFGSFAKGYLAFLQQKYSYKSDSSYPTTCVGRTSASPQAPGSKEQLVDQYKHANKQIVETGWKNQ